MLDTFSLRQRTAGFDARAEADCRHCGRRLTSALGQSGTSVCLSWLRIGSIYFGVFFTKGSNHRLGLGKNTVLGIVKRDRAA